MKWATAAARARPLRLGGRRDRLVDAGADASAATRSCGGTCRPRVGDEGTASSPRQVVAILREHIRTVIDRYRGKMQARGTSSTEPFERRGHAARGRLPAERHRRGLRRRTHSAPRARPATRTASSYSTTTAADGRRAEGRRAVRGLVRGLRARGVPLDGVGLQAHCRPPRPACPTASERHARALRGARARRRRHRGRRAIELPRRCGEAARTQAAAVRARWAAPAARLGRCRGSRSGAVTDAESSWIPQAYAAGPGRRDAPRRRAAPKPASARCARALAGGG